MTTGDGLVVFGVLYFLTAVVGIGLAALRDARTLRLRLESEERQAKIAAAAANFNVKFTPTKGPKLK